MNRTKEEWQADLDAYLRWLEWDKSGGTLDADRQARRDDDVPRDEQLEGWD